MNIESLLDKIDLFNQLFIHSGLKRDLTDYSQAIQQPQNRTVVYMSDILSKILDSHEELESNSMGTELEIVLRDSTSIMQIEAWDVLKSLQQNPSADANQYFQSFNTQLANIITTLDQNINEINALEQIFNKYRSVDSKPSDANRALISIIFKDLESTKNLKQFSKVLNIWSRTLLIYHTLLTSESPEEIALVEVQNGSIDIIVNVDFNIALDFGSLVEAGLKVYAAYLVYKSKRAREIIDSYLGNKKLIAQEKEREKLMLENIKESIKGILLEQHKASLNQDKKIDKTGVTKKVDQVSSMLSNHIIKGNQVKLMLPPATEEDESEEREIVEKIRSNNSLVQQRMKELPEKERKLLLETYPLPDEDDKK